MYRIVTGKDGRMQTDDADLTDAAAEVKRMRKELRDMLDGNVQFHEDPRAAPVEQPQAQVDIDFAEFILLANDLLQDLLCKPARPAPAGAVAFGGVEDAGWRNLK